MLWMAVLGAILLWSATPIESQHSTQRRQGKLNILFLITHEKVFYRLRCHWIVKVEPVSSNFNSSNFRKTHRKIGCHAIRRKI